MVQFHARRARRVHFGLCQKTLLAVFYLMVVVATYVASHMFYRDGPAHNPQILEIEYVEKNLHTLDQEDPQLIHYTRVRHLSPPSKLRHNSIGNNGNTSSAYEAWVLDYLKGKENGVFIEAGAFDGVMGSHTLYLEKKFGWTGLLIECNPMILPELRMRQRKAWIADACISPSAHAATLNFSNPDNWSHSGTIGITRRGLPGHWTQFEVQAIPLYTMLAALGWKEVDYFKFDIEGVELDVLRVFPFDLFTFKVIIIEILYYSMSERAELDNILKANGYDMVKNLEDNRIYVYNRGYWK